MENNNLGQPKRRLNYGSIDGFVAPHHHLKKPVPDKENSFSPGSDSMDNLSSMETKSTKPAFAQKSNGDSPSLLNMNLPGNLAQNARSPKRKKKHSSWKTYLKRTALTLLVLILLGGGWLGFKFYRNVAKLTHDNNPFAAIASALNQVSLKSEGDWVNVLVAGYDPSDGDITTDTIMVVSVNKVTNQALMLSIPRDTWVNNMPGFGHQKINASNDISSFSAPGYPKGGMGELEQQVHDKMGITSDYYVLVNNQAYVDGVNAVGGIDVNIQSPDQRGLYDPNVDKANGGPLLLSNGWHHLTGLGALALVKARGDIYSAYGFPNSDFDREEHARQVVVAMKDKALTSGVIANPLRLSQLADAVGNNVQTDIKLSDASGFYNLMKKVKDANIKSQSIDTLNGVQLLHGMTIEGLDVEVPTAGVDNFSQIQSQVQRLYSSNPVFQESANTVILNGSSVTGLAGREQTILNGDGLSVTQVGDPTGVYPDSMIIDQSQGKAPASAQLLQKLFPTNTTYTKTVGSSGESAEAKSYPNASFVIVLGQNWNANTTP